MRSDIAIAKQSQQLLEGGGGGPKGEAAHFIHVRRWRNFAVNTVAPFASARKCRN